MTELQYKQWERDSQHDSYNTANERRLTLFSKKIEGLQVKVKRTAEGKFVVKTRVPLPPPAPKKKAPAKTRKKTVATTKTDTRKTAPKAAPKEEPKPAASKPEAKKRTRKTSRKRK